MPDIPTNPDELESVPEKKSEDFDSDALTVTQSLIGRLSVQMDDLTRKHKEFRDMLKGVFENDEVLAKAEEAAKEATQSAKSRKQDLKETAEVKDIKMKLAEAAEDIKMVKESLNIHLVNYFQMTNSMTVDMPDGTEREFKIEAKLKPKKMS
jgi:predicted  nucleic acid-binding Zn-ribbon protein